MKFYKIRYSSQLIQELLRLILSISVYYTLNIYYIFGYSVDMMLPRRTMESY